MAKIKLNIPKKLKDMSVDDIINMDARNFQSMNEDEIRYLVGRVARRVNHRLKKIEEIPYGRSTPAYNEFREGEYTETVRLSKDDKKRLNKGSKSVTTDLRGKGISVTANPNKKGSKVRVSLKGVSLDNVKRTFYKSRDFLASKTSTPEGIEEVTQEMAKRLGVEDLNVRSAKKFWNIYHEVRKNNPELESILTSDQLQQVVLDYYSNYNKKTTKSGKTRYLSANEIAKMIAKDSGRTKSEYDKATNSPTNIAKRFYTDED